MAGANAYASREGGDVVDGLVPLIATHGAIALLDPLADQALRAVIGAVQVIAVLIQRQTMPCVGWEIRTGRSGYCPGVMLSDQPDWLYHLSRFAGEVAMGVIVQKSAPVAYLDKRTLITNVTVIRLQSLDIRVNGR
jgi:hypothetical protein